MYCSPQEAFKLKNNLKNRLTKTKTEKQKNRLTKNKNRKTIYYRYQK